MLQELPKKVAGMTTLATAARTAAAARPLQPSKSNKGGEPVDVDNLCDDGDVSIEMEMFSTSSVITPRAQVRPSLWQLMCTVTPPLLR